MWGLGGALLFSAALIYFDVRERRLPNWLTIPAAVLAVVWAVANSPLALLGLIWPALYLGVGLVVGGIGGGDIKLAIPLGIVSAAVGGLLGVWGAMVLASVFTVVASSLLKTVGTAHGPGMLAGTWCVLLTAPVFSQYMA